MARRTWSRLRPSPSLATAAAVRRRRTRTAANSAARQHDRRQSDRLSHCVCPFLREHSSGARDADVTCPCPRSVVGLRPAMRRPCVRAAGSAHHRDAEEDEDEQHPVDPCAVERLAGQRDDVADPVAAVKISPMNRPIRPRETPIRMPVAMNGTVDGHDDGRGTAGSRLAPNERAALSSELSTVLTPSMTTTSVAGTAESTMMTIRAVSLMPTHEQDQRHQDQPRRRVERPDVRC